MIVQDEKFALPSKSINYLLALPEAYEQDGAAEWPLILFLHGSNRRGDDIALLRDYGLNTRLQHGNGQPFLVLTPQCPGDSSWTDELENIMLLVDDILDHYSVDRKCVYLTGFSMGGHGAWYYAAHKPGLFAAVSPLSGWFNPDQAELLKDIPIWAFHGDADDVVPFERTHEMIEALKDMNPQIRFTPIPGEGHRIMHYAYDQDEWIEWMLSHKLKI
ncbi:phospholipase [Paenibacillus sp. 1011MAR3C5]|uniref:carboxylesterase family protein n=1 Tax=Paenibacillus sp. 1011MAR3C5 TaxID=1675787 RepID=UPI000E6BF272|nr:dienelactone hydrolase family protein [Paenibacillus sp. 1011MAR3C5]RJE90308.1 phospholipase [Paenibacillus sp. 1011MAR3C5]